MRQRIGAVARALGLSAKTIRFYEDIGLVPRPTREGSGWLSVGQRVYEEPELERLRFVKEARQRDFAIDEIRQLLVGYESGPACGCGARPLLKSLLERKLHDIDETITHLQELRNEIRGIYARTVSLEKKTPKDLLKSGTPTPTEAMFGTGAHVKDSPNKQENKR